MQETQVHSLGWKVPLVKEMATHSSILPGKSHGQKSLVGYSPWGPKESDRMAHVLDRWMDGWMGSLTGMHNEDPVNSEGPGDLHLPHLSVLISRWSKGTLRIISALPSRRLTL